MKLGREDAKAIIIGIVVALVMTAVMFVAMADAPRTQTDVEIETAPGMPLDAIRYDRPTWMPDADQVFEVSDRKNGAKWWVIKTNRGEVVVLPIGREER